MPTDSEHAPVTERYPELADIDEQDNDRKLETYRNVLESLQHELDNKPQLAEVIHSPASGR